MTGDTSHPPNSSNVVASEQQLWLAIIDRPGGCVKKSYVTSQLALSSDEDSNAWLMDRPHLFQVQSSYREYPMMANSCSPQLLHDHPYCINCMEEH